MQKNNAPPAVRVFISSTFADMQDERNALNTVIFPKLSEMCRERGVSFFSLDLRWGITREQQENDEVVKLCMDEIDNCRPFFIGMLGSRYGWVPARFEKKVADALPWIKKYEGKSITEIEMLYGILDVESSVGDAAFYIRDDGECEEDTRLCELKKRVRQSGFPVTEGYKNIEDFSNAVLRDFSMWIEKYYPPAAQVHTIRADWYMREQLRDYVENEKAQGVLSNALANSKMPLVVYGAPGCGKTALLNYCAQNFSGNKIIINLNADDELWGVTSLMLYILKCIDGIYPALHGEISRLLEEGGGDDAFIRSIKFRRAFAGFLENLQLDTPLIIVINDIDLLYDINGARFLSWLPCECNSGLHIALSLNDGQMLLDVQRRGFGVVNMGTSDPEISTAAVVRYLKNRGKSLSKEQLEMLYNCPCVKNIGCMMLLARVTAQYAVFETLDDFLNNAAAAQFPEQFYLSLLISLYKMLDSQDGVRLLYLLALVKNSRRPLHEGYCFAMLSGEFGINRIQYLNIIRFIYPFCSMQKDFIFPQSALLRNFLNSWEVMDKFDYVNLHSRLALCYCDAFERDVLHNENENDGAYLCTVICEYTHHLEKSEQWQRLCDVISQKTVLQILLENDPDTLRYIWHTINKNTNRTAEELYADIIKSGTHNEIVLGLIFNLRFMGIDCAPCLPDQSIDENYNQSSYVWKCLAGGNASRKSQMLERQFETCAQSEKTAGEYFEAFLDFFNDNKGDVFARCLAFKHGARFAAAYLGDFEQAENIVNCYFDDACSIGYASDVAQALFLRAMMCLRKNNTDTAIEFLNRAHKMAYECGDTQLCHKAEEILNNIDCEGGVPNEEN